MIIKDEAEVKAEKIVRLVKFIQQTDGLHDLQNFLINELDDTCVDLMTIVKESRIDRR